MLAATVITCVWAGSIWLLSLSSRWARISLCRLRRWSTNPPLLVPINSQWGHCRELFLALGSPAFSCAWNLLTCRESPALFLVWYPQCGHWNGAGFSGAFISLRCHRILLYSDSGGFAVVRAASSLAATVLLAEPAIP